MRLVPLVLVCLTLLLCGCERTVPIDAAEKQLLMTVDDLSQLGLEHAVPTRGVFTKTENPLDGSASLTYEYQWDEKAKDEKPFFLYSVINKENKDSDADLTEMGMKIGLEIGFSKAMTQAPQPQFPKYGDASSMKRLDYKGKPAGNVFFVRQGHASLMVLISGMYFDDPKDWTPIVTRKLALLREQSAK